MNAQDFWAMMVPTSLLGDGENGEFARICGSCGCSGKLIDIPCGACMAVSLEQTEDFEKQPIPHYARYHVNQKCLDVGAGNFLTLRFITVADAYASITGEGYNYNTVYKPPPLDKIKDGPPVHALYWAGLAYYFGSWSGANHVSKEKMKENVKQFKSGTYVFQIQNVQLPQFTEKFLIECELEKELLYRSPPHNNRVHHTHTDTLNLFVIQRK